ncbi:hypothetical protein SFMTTN_2047 [Sulfuriferula multivorans]|uniref:Uncharacterized protein n=1 Tax=Sulfuriferula multivorans TaxID=1559896 RepID=A0A401JF60_9PROT|nr:hypothetical protein [Sulfuriferula multivorans]GBL46234.1 hypothetical protein SFMTTN_2047 [Sulfuriferula multivorans]
MSQINYEKGERMPDAAYLSAIAAAGADVQYILTGLRAGALAVEETRAGYIVEYVTPEEEALLENFRHAPPEGQAALKATSAALAYQQAAEAKPALRTRKSVVEFSDEYTGPRTGPVEFGDEMKPAPGKKRKDDAA